jgi:two-component system, cell cycle response regulator CpdR
MSKIFLVNNDGDQIKLFTDALERYGFESSSYANPVTALKNFRAGIYDAAIIDVMLPEMNGLELSQKLMDVDRFIPIVYLTAVDLHSNELNREYANVQWIIRKPVTIRKLIEEINSVLALGQNMPLL